MVQNLYTSKNLEDVVFEIGSQHTGRRKHALFSRNSSRSQSSSAHDHHHHQGKGTVTVQEMWDSCDHICTQFKHKHITGCILPH